GAGQPDPVLTPVGRSRSGGLPDRLGADARHLALGSELEQMRVHLPPGGFHELGRQSVTAVQRGDDLLDAEPVTLADQAQDLLAPRLAVREVVVDPGSGLVDHVTVTGTDPGEAEWWGALGGGGGDPPVAPP